ncbi:hypothetical protein HDU86_000054 [Geranomyces michiganensis]|nr:hypothetical protein HDU86_000054 [Geranomyces michiganensis]
MSATAAAAASSRVRSVLNHLSSAAASAHQPHVHQLSPTFFLERAAEIEADALAIVHITADGAPLRRSYRELAARAIGLANYFKMHNFKRVGILAPSTPAFLESIYGIVAAGGVVVPVNYRLKEDDIAYIFDFAEVDCIIVDKEFEGLLVKYTKTHPSTRLIVDLDTVDLHGAGCGPFNVAIMEGQAYDRAQGKPGWAALKSKVIDDENEMLAIPFTSGTTSRPKGVIYTHRGAYLAAVANIIESGLNVGTRCKFLWTLPMFHAMGWTFPWSVVAVRGVNVCLRKVDYPLIWKLLKEEGITHFNAAPTVNTLLVAAKEAERLPNPVKVTVAASPPSGHLFEKMTKLNLMPVHVYGMTETYGPITKCYHLPQWDELPDQEKYAKMARQGHGFITSLPIRVVKPDRPDGVYTDVARNGREIGEIVFFGNICSPGYYKDAEATRQLFAGGSGGGLHSGDLAVWHPDGSAQIVDRAKDIIISGGENISSIALESMLVEHPDILEAGVVAVSDSHWGERPKAYVTLREGAARGGDSGEPNPIAGSLIIEWARTQSNISRFMIPREVEIVAELPKTSTGKIKKNVLREWAKNGTPSS